MNVDRRYGSRLTCAAALAAFVVITPFAVRGATVASPAPMAPASPVPAAAPSVTPVPAPPSDPCLQMSSLVSRPSVATSPCSVKRGDLLLESGYSNTATSGGGGSTSALYPQGAIRAGMGGNLEFDIDPPSIERLSAAPAVTGTTDSGIGLHYEFGYTDKYTLGTNVVYTLADGSPQFSANGEGALLNLDGAYAISPAFGLFATLGFETQSAGGVDDAARYRAFAPALGITYTLPAGFDVFVEGFGQSASGPGQSGRYAYDVALQKDIGTRLQLDANFFNDPAAGSGPHQSAAGFGVSYLVGPSH